MFLVLIFNVMEPILSIVVPTKNRYKYLYELVDVFLKDNYGDIELVIQDNSDDNTEFYSFIQPLLVNEKLKYAYTKEHLDVCANSDLSIISSSGKYVCFIGDDDGYTSLLPKVAKWMDQNSVDCVSSYHPMFYWPDVPSSTFNYSGCIVLDKDSLQVKKTNPLRILRKMLNQGCFSLDEIPRVYHGVVSRKVLNLIYEKTGSFFPGPSPDMANAVGCALNAKNAYVIYAPLIISGTSSKSTAGLGLAHKHVGKIEEKTFLPSYTLSTWFDILPKFWTGPTIYAQSALYSLTQLDREDLKKEFNINRFYANFLTSYNDFSLLKPLMSKAKANLLAIYYYKLIVFLIRVNCFVHNFVNKKIKKNRVLRNYAHLEDVKQFFKEQYDSRLILP